MCLAAIEAAVRAPDNVLAPKTTVRKVKAHLRLVSSMCLQHTARRTTGGGGAKDTRKETIYIYICMSDAEVLRGFIRNHITSTTTRGTRDETYAEEAKDTLKET